MEKQNQLSREYLEEAFREARKAMPGWLWAYVHSRAFPRSGARARLRIPVEEPQLSGPLDFDALPQNLVLVPDFVSVVGSAAKDDAEPKDIDIVTRAELDERGCYGVHADSVHLPLRNVLDPEKTGCLHWIDSPQGPHGDNVPLYDLVLRRKDDCSRKVVKSISSTGPENPAIAFIGAVPSKTDAARQEPFTGPIGKVFNDVYLGPLDIARAEAMLANVCPVHLAEPNDDNVAEHKESILQELDERSPRIVVALGRVARAALGDRADYFLPHPSAVLRFGDGGEVGRKLKKIKKQLEEGETREEKAAREWEENWHNMLPSSGKGRFVYQHHWRGLNDEEIELSDAQLMETDHSIHGDLRLEGDNGLWGVAVLLGRADDNRDREQHDRLIDPKPEEKIATSIKSQHPKNWLDVGVDKPLVSAPGEVGATSQKYAKFFGIDHGDYKLGVARKHGVEIFLDGKYLKGRYLLQFAPFAGQRRWLIDKPEEQTPAAERIKLADLLAELRAKRQKFLFWSGPEQRTQKINVSTGEVVKSLVHVTKADEEKQILYCVVLSPHQFDAHGDWIPPSEVETTAHEWAKKYRLVSRDHNGPSQSTMVETWVEQYPSDKDYRMAMIGEPHRAYRRDFGNSKIHSGDWAIGIKVGDKEWQDYKDGKIGGVSIEGYGTRSPANQASMPKVIYVDLIAVNRGGGGKA